jgi:hypothetical protein
MMQSKVIIGGDIIKKIGAEAMKDLVTNKTMIIQKLTNDQQSEPEIVLNLTNIDEIFDHFKPSLKTSFIDNMGNKTVEEMKFSSIADFSLGGISRRSEYLHAKELKINILKKILLNMKSNNLLRRALLTDEGKTVLLKSLLALRKDLLENAQH